MKKYRKALIPLLFVLLIPVMAQCMGHRPQRQPNEPTPPSDSGTAPTWQIVFEDNFDGNSLNQSVWYDHDPQWLEGPKPGCFCPPMVTVKDGLLHLWAYYCPQWLPEGYEYALGLIKSKQSFAPPVIIEASIKGINAETISTGFWLYEHNLQLWTEIGIVEAWAGWDDWGTLWQGGLYKHSPEPKISDHKEADLGYNIADDFHTYKLEWLRDSVTISVDDVVVRQTYNTGYLSQAMPVLLSVQPYPGWLPLPDPSCLPAEMQVDWVRIYKQQ